MKKITTSRYRLAGIVIESELPLVGLPVIHEDAKDVVIRIDIPPRVGEDALEIEPGCLANPLEYWQSFPGVANFYLRGGEEIIVEPLDKTRLDETRSYLFSVIFAVLFFRRGLLPLHASAVRVRDQVFAFLGRSGAGKSSLAAGLRLRGYQVIADDLTLLQPAETGVTKVTPCAPWLKLWKDSIPQVASQEKGWEPIAGKDFKFRLPLSEKQGEPPSLALAGLFVLERSESGKAEVSSLLPAAAVAKMMLYAYSILLVHKLGDNFALFRQCAEILEHVPMWSFYRPWDLQGFGAGLDCLEEQFSTILLKT
jgi:hypothetical protein